MAKSERQKLKLLYLFQIFWFKTDVRCPFTIKQLIDELAAVNVSASRKSLYDDIRLLKEFGMDIRMNKDYGYYIAKHYFEKTELKILMDAIHSARFLSQKRSRQLIEKLGTLTCLDQKKQLIGLLLSKNRRNLPSVDCYGKIQLLYEAILTNCRVSFHCFRVTPERTLFLYNNGNPYVVSPWELFWFNNFYYLVCYRHETERMEYFRIDRLMKIKVLDKPREGRNIFAALDLQRFAPEEVAGAYPASITGLTLRCTNSLSGSIMERFGNDVIIIPDGDKTFTVAVRAAVNSKFYAWVFSYGGEMEIVSPQYLVTEMRQMLLKVGARYGLGQTPSLKTGD